MANPYTDPIDMSDFWNGYVCGCAMGVAIIAFPTSMYYWLT